MLILHFKTYKNINRKSMNTFADKPLENKRQSVVNAVSQLRNSGESPFQFIDNRPEVIAQRKLHQFANNNQQTQRVAQLQAMVNNRSEQQSQPLQKKPNNTGLPDDLKTGVENLSGISLDNVKVHYNSDKPAQLNAHAYAQGSDIHLAPGQEQHLPHEAWHVVQQAQGRVKPTMQMKGDVPVNDDAGLEHEVDEMGAKVVDFESLVSNQSLQDISNVSGSKEVTQRAYAQNTYRLSTGKTRNIEVEGGGFQAPVGLVPNPLLDRSIL